MQRFCLALMVAAACTRPQPQPVVHPWRELAWTDAIRVAYDAASVRLLQDGAYEVMIRQDYRARQTFRDTAYTQQEMRVRLLRRRRQA